MSDKQMSSLGPCRQLRAMRFCDKVLVKWHDPFDKFDENMQATARWKHTVLVRNYDHIPINEHDGEVVRYITTRNAHDEATDPYFIDFIQYGRPFAFYNAFAISTEDECNVGEGCAAEDITAKDIADIIRGGRASDLFNIGDILDVGNGVMFVVDFDHVKPVGEGLNHSVTFAFATKRKLVFDTAEEYFHTNKIRVLNTDTQFYRRERNDKFVKTFPLVSTDLTQDDLFETYFERKSQVRAQAGSNLWVDSSIRHYLKFYAREDLLSKVPDAIRKAIVDVVLHTKQPLIDGGGVAKSIDNVWLPSMSQLGCTHDPSEGDAFDITRCEIMNQFQHRAWTRSANLSSETEVYHVDLSPHEAGSIDEIEDLLVAFTIG